MKDGKSWIVDSYIDYIKKYAPQDCKVTEFSVDVNITQLLKLAEDNDIIYSSYWQPFCRNNLVEDKRFPGDKVIIQVWHLMDSKHRSYDPNTLKLANPNVKHIIYPCRNTQERLELLGCKANMYKMDMCLDINKYKATYPPKLNDILYVGSFSKDYPRKRFDILRNAMNNMEDAELLTSYGKIKDIITGFKKLHIYVSTSDEEGGPVGVLEAMACGIPVVTTNTGFSADLIKHGINGFLIPFNDADALIERLKWIRENYNESLAIGENGRKTVSKYTPQRFVKSYIELYRRIAK